MNFIRLGLEYQWHLHLKPATVQTVLALMTPLHMWHFQKLQSKFAELKYTDGWNWNHVHFYTHYVPSVNALFQSKQH